MSRRKRQLHRLGKMKPRYNTHDPDPEYLPTNTLDAHIADARKRMGEKRWARLVNEWNDL